MEIIENKRKARVVGAARGALLPAVSVLALLAYGSSVDAQSGVDYSGQTLEDTNFRGADLRGANFTNATLKGVEFSQADLSGAIFRGAVLGEGTLGSTDFTLANLTNAQMSDMRLDAVVSFQYSEISGTDFTGIDATLALFGPSPTFDRNGQPPIFANANMDCEFPWIWEALDLTGATLPDCENADAGLVSDDTSPTPTATSSDPSAPQPPTARSHVQHPIENLGLAPEYSAEEADLDAENSIFVSSAGTDSATCGATADASCATIAEGITRCAAVGLPCSVLVGYGKYALTQSIVMQDQISVTGGYVGGQPSAYQSTVTAPADGVPAITASAVSATIKNFIFVGSASTNPATASTVMSVLNSDGIVLDTVQILAASGKDVSAAAAPGAAKNGVTGAAYNAGNAGGASQCGTNNAGGSGGNEYIISVYCTGNWTNGCTTHCSYSSGTWYGSSGAAGQSTGGGGSTSPGSKACTFNGTGAATPTGGTGGTGAAATTVAAASANRIGNLDATTGAWTPVASTSGQAGNDGGGGGGGGAGQPDVTTHCKIFSSCGYDTHNGLGGGGGGSGGCGATGGGGGAMGGATFGIVLVNSKLGVGEALKVVGAQGGTGGDGGTGVTGGTAGGGGAGCGGSCGGAAQSGAGGSGGPGGASGGGAGGNGGPSIGIVLVGADSTFDKSVTSIYPGASGTPGKGAAGGGTAPTGANGQTGLAQATYSDTQ